MGLIQFILAFVGVYLSAYVIAYLAPRFASQQDMGRAVPVVAYSYTPAWVAGILSLSLLWEFWCLWAASMVSTSCIWACLR